MQQELWARDQRVPGDWTHLSSRPGPWGLPGAVVGIRGRRGDTGGDKGGPRWRQGVTGGTQGGHRVPWELWSARGGDSSPVLLSSIIEENTPESEDGAGSCYLVTSGLLARHLTIWPSQHSEAQALWHSQAPVKKL